MVKLFACGVDQYRGESGLDFCVNDSLKFCDTFAENIVINRQDISIVTEDGYISHTDYCKALKKFCDEASIDDTLLVFHSGHGGIDEQGDNFLVMSDSFNEDTYVYTDQIINFLNKSKAKTKIVILDCCQSDVGEKWIPAIDMNAIVDDFYAQGITIFSACGRKEEATSENGITSVFTDFLCDALQDKHLIRDGLLYFNDFQNLVAIYAANYNRVNPDKMQTPIMRTSMIGTATFSVRCCKAPKVIKKYSYECSDFDLLNLELDSKLGNENTKRKFVSACVVLKGQMEEENIELYIKKIIDTMGKLDIPIVSKRQMMVKNNPIEIVNITIFNDYIDYEANIFKYHIKWTLHADKQWIHKDSFKRMSEGYYSCQSNLMYEYLKKTRIENIFTDNELISFWKRQIDIVIKKTSEFDRIYHAFKGGDMSIQDLCSKAKKVYINLGQIYNECDNSCFPMPFSEYKNFHDKSLQLVTDARYLVYICAFPEKDCTKARIKTLVELELINFYKSFREWSEMIKNIN